MKEILLQEPAILAELVALALTAVYMGKLSIRSAYPAIQSAYPGTGNNITDRGKRTASRKQACLFNKEFSVFSEENRHIKNRSSLRKHLCSLFNVGSTISLPKRALLKQRVLH